MIYQNIAGKIDKASSIILGCMRMPALNKNEAADLISHAFDDGINYFDHATIYGNGEAEIRFGEAFKDTGLKRDEVIIQSKCGLHIDRQEFDWSKGDIIESVEGSLKRLWIIWTCYYFTDRIYYLIQLRWQRHLTGLKMRER